MTLAQRHLCGTLSLLFLLLAATPRAAADNYLKLVPGTALAWGAVNHMKEATDKIQKLGAVMQMPAPNVFEELKREAGVSTGLDENGAAGFFVVPGKSEKGGVATAIFAAVADEKEFLANFQILNTEGAIREVRPKPVEEKPAANAKPPQRIRPPVNTSAHALAFRNGYALLAPKSDRAALEAALEAKSDISAEMTGCEAWLSENDGSIVGTAAGIRYAAKQAAEELKKSKANLDASPAAMPQLAVFSAMFNLYSQVLEAAPSELSLALGGVRCDKEGSIRVIGRAQLKSGGLVSKVVAGIPPAKENLLAGLPGGQFVVAGGGVGIPGLADAYMNMAITLMKSFKPVTGKSGDELERMRKESLDVFRQVRAMNFVMKTGKRSDPLYSNMYSLLQVENAKQLLDAQEKYVAKASDLIPDIKPAAVKSTSIKRLEIAGRPALLQEISFDPSSLTGPGVNGALFEEMVGVGGKMLIYYVAADEHQVLAGIGVSPERMVAGLDVIRQPKKSLAQDPDLSITAAMLPADSQWAAYISMRGCMQFSQRMMTMATKNNPQAMGFTLPPFPKCPPIGVAVKAESAELHAEAAIPSGVVRAYGEYIQEVQKAFMNQMQQNQPPAPAP